MKAGDDVLVFTASGTFSARRGTVVRESGRDVVVKLEGESHAMTFERSAVVPLADSTPSMVAGE